MTKLIKKHEVDKILKLKITNLMNCAKRENIFLMICFVQLDFQAMIFALEVKPARFF